MQFIEIKDAMLYLIGYSDAEREVVGRAIGIIHEVCPIESVSDLYERYTDLKFEALENVMKYTKVLQPSNAADESLFYAACELFIDTMDAAIIEQDKRKGEKTCLCKN